MNPLPQGVSSVEKVESVGTPDTTEILNTKSEEVKKVLKQETKLKEEENVVEVAEKKFPFREIDVSDWFDGNLVDEFFESEELINLLWKKHKKFVMALTEFAQNPSKHGLKNTNQPMTLNIEEKWNHILVTTKNAINIHQKTSWELALDRLKRGIAIVNDISNDKDKLKEMYKIELNRAKANQGAMETLNSDWWANLGFIDMWAKIKAAGLESDIFDYKIDEETEVLDRQGNKLDNTAMLEMTFKFPIPKQEAEAA